MNLFQLSWKNSRRKPLSTLLTVVLFGTGIAIIISIMLLSGQMEQQFKKNLGGIDMVVGAKGSPLQLILSSVYHVDVPTGNIKVKDTKFLKQEPLVEKTIPLALGDSYRGFRIVGSEHSYPAIYNAELAQGDWWKNPLEATIGSRVAAELGLQVGDEFAGAHGLETTISDHDEHHYKVVGIMQPTNTVMDQLICTSIESIWQLHDHEEEEEKPAVFDPLRPKRQTQVDQEITAMLVFFKTPVATLSLPAKVNAESALQAASPTIESSRLFSLLDTVSNAARLLAIFIMIVSALSVFIALLNSLKDRQYEIAVIRVMGAGPKEIFLMVVLEGLLIAAMGAALGLLLGHGGMAILAGYLQAGYHYSFSAWDFQSGELIVLLVALTFGIVAAILPGIRAMQTDISKTLSKA